MYVWVGARLAVEILICSTEPSAAVAEPYISGIKSDTVLHVSRSSCTLARSYTSFGRCTLIQSQQKQMTHSVKHKVQMQTIWMSPHIQNCRSGECGPLPLSLLLRLQNDSWLPAAQGRDYHFITACHYSDAINGNELADNWFTITLPSSTPALGEPLVLIDLFLLSASSDWL